MLLQGPSDFSLSKSTFSDSLSDYNNGNGDFSCCSLQCLKSKDVEAIRAFTCTLLNAFYSTGFFLQFLLTKNHICLFLTSPDNPKDIVGAITGKLEIDGDKGKGHIYTLSVDPKCRRHGLGRKLIDEFELNMIKLAKGSGVELTSLCLEAKGGDGCARAFYEKLGFNVSGEKENYYSSGGDCIYFDRCMR